MDNELSPQDIQDLQEIAEHLPAGDPRVAKVNLLLNSQPTQFEKDRTPDAKTGGWWNAVKQNIPSNTENLSATDNSQGRPISVRGAGAVGAENSQAQYEAEQASRKAAGYGPLYRAVAPVGEYGFGVNAPGMEEAAAHGDSGAIVGHATIPAALAVAPLAVEGVARGGAAAVRGASKVASKAAPAVAGVADAAAGVLDNDIAGMVSPRLRHAGSAAGKLADLIKAKIAARNIPEQVISGEEGSLPATTPSDVPLEHMPQEAGAGKPPVNEVPANVPPEMANIYKLRRGYQDNFEDAQIRQAMSDDLYRHAVSAGREVRAQQLAERQAAGLDVPKWERSATFKAQQIMEQAQQQAQDVIEQARQKGERGLMASVPRNPAAEAAAEEVASQPAPVTTAQRLSATQDLEELLRKSIARAKAAKAK